MLGSCTTNAKAAVRQTFGLNVDAKIEHLLPFALDKNQEDLAKRFFSDAAECFGSHAEHRGEVLQWNLVEEFAVLLEEKSITLFCAHRKMCENAVFEHYEAFGNKQFLDFRSTRNLLIECVVVTLVDGE